MNVTTIAPGIDPAASAASGHWVHNLDPIALDLGFFQLRWYSLAYLAGIIIGWMYMLRLIRAPGAPMARRHADDMVFYATLGIILGGRLGYVLFYRPLYYLEHPVEIVRLWDGGMSFHGGLIGTLVAILYLTWRNKLSFLRVSDYVACCVPFGLFFGRVANFVNGELFGHPTQVAWAVRFPEVIGGIEVAGPPRHPSQLYEAGLEGVALFLILFVLFWWTRARYKPGLLAGVFAVGYGVSRFVVEYFRLPDAHLRELAATSGLSMGQWLTVPMLLIGLYLIFTAGRREPLMAPAEEAEDDAPPPDAERSAEPA